MYKMHKIVFYAPVKSSAKSCFHSQILQEVNYVSSMFTITSGYSLWVLLTYTMELCVNYYQACNILLVYHCVVASKS